PESTAYEDRLVQAGRVELVHCLHEGRRRQPFARGLLAAERDHVRRDVATVDVEPRAEIWKEQAAGPARDVERRLAVAFDAPLKVRDLVRPKVVVELGPPFRDQPVVPCLGGILHSSPAPFCWLGPQERAVDAAHGCCLGPTTTSSSGPNITGFIQKPSTHGRL